MSMGKCFNTESGMYLFRFSVQHNSDSKMRFLAFCMQEYELLEVSMTIIGFSNLRALILALLFLTICTKKIVVFWNYTRNTISISTFKIEAMRIICKVWIMNVRISQNLDYSRPTIL